MKQPNIIFKSLLTGIKDIKERNKYFDYLSDEGKRLEIAWDLLNLVKNKVIYSSAGGYYWNGSLKTSTEDMTSKQMHEYLNTESKIKGCSVCARGGMMLSQIRLGNTLNGLMSERESGFRGDGNLGNYLRGFTVNEFKRMENEYEANTYDHPYHIRTDEKLMNICCNVLVNGFFNPDDKTDYLI